MPVPDVGAGPSRSPACRGACPMSAGLLLDSARGDPVTSFLTSVVTSVTHMDQVTTVTLLLCAAAFVVGVMTSSTRLIGMSLLVVVVLLAVPAVGSTVDGTVHHMMYQLNAELQTSSAYP